jgi:thiamine transport system substrate-binding protein
MTMKKITVVIIILLTIFPSFAGCKSTSSQPTVLTIYTYDSFISYGLPDATNKIFEDKYNCKIEYKSFGGVDATLNKLILEKGSPQADLFVGLNMNEFQRALDNDLFLSYKPSNFSVIPEEYRIDNSWRLIPFDGPNSIAILYDSSRMKNPPSSLKDLTKDEYRGKLIIEDPRTSSPGLGFLLWTVAVFGENNYLDYWKSIKKTVFHVYPEWDPAFEAFKSGEAPMMISYDLDPAYFYYTDKTTTYKSVVPSEGGWLQLEFVGIIKGTRNKTLAEKYVDFILSSDFQNEIPLHQWTYPINKSVELPDCFKYAQGAKKFVTLPPAEIKSKSEQWIKQWSEMIISQ